MKLRKLIVAGFKSFADRTEFDFHDGISCIVGPNGCGKSNVVDAIKWVLGEQSAKSLRGSAMQDVIFNGSSTRKASGMAEVTLVFDNAAGTLQPTLKGQTSPQPVVSVTRRLYRSGQSGYLINKTPSRLKDIREMFMDTGIGVDSYAVIEQGQVTNFVQASQEERRAIFDEAAGISKYKARKKEALRKLERVEQNLLRVADILTEVERRLRSIKLQAGKARNYQGYVERLRELRGLHFLSQYHALTARRTELERQTDHLSDCVSQLNSRIHQFEAAQSAAEVEGVDLERTSRELEGQIATISGQISTCEQRVEMLTRRVGELGEQLVQTAARSETLEAKIQQTAQQRQQVQQEMDALEADDAGLGQRYETIRGEHTASQHEINKLQNELEEHKAARLDLIRQGSQLANVIHSLGVRRESLLAQGQRLDGRVVEIDKALTEYAAHETELAAERETVRGQIAASEEELARAKEACAALVSSENQLRASLSQLREQRSGIQSRTHALNEMQQRLEGVAGGVRRVLEAQKKGSLQFLGGMFASLLDSDVEHAPLVEAALAGADQQLVADRLADVQAGGEELTRVLGAKGAVEILCLDAVPTSEPVAVPGGLDGIAVVGRVADWVRGDASVRAAIEHLLGRTLAVETFADAIAARQRLEGWRFVARTGEVLEADGRVRLGAEGRSAGVITRRSELASLESRRQELDGQISDLQARCEHARGEIGQLEERQGTLRSKVYEANTRRVGIEGRLGQVREAAAKLQRERPVVVREIEQLQGERTAMEDKERDARARQQEMEARGDDSQGRIEALEGQVRQARERFAQLSEQMTEVKVALAQAQQKKLAVRESVARLGRELSQMENDLAEGHRRLEMDRQRRTEAEQGIAASKEEIEQLYGQHQTISRESADVDESRRGIKTRLDEIRLSLSEHRKEHEAASGRLSASRMEHHEAEVRIENLINRSSDEMGMNVVELYETYEHDAERDWQAVEEEIDDLRGKIDRLGNVNLDAITEQEELEARQEFLSRQLADVEESKRQLTSLIDRINDESRELFSRTFQAIRENFQALFRKLFGGGKADILLENPDDVLESNIDIVARPPGKELQSLSLLSGGEKTMTALGLIFAIFRSKPSPFCLLDEVDAALDEANIDRFSKLLTEFNDTSQFIVITHAKRTMTIGDVLYGVTMQEPGVSKRISVRFEEAENLDRNLEPAAV